MAESGQSDTWSQYRYRERDCNHQHDVIESVQTIILKIFIYFWINAGLITFMSKYDD